MFVLKSLRFPSDPVALSCLAQCLGHIVGIKQIFFFERIAAEKNAYLPTAFLLHWPDSARNSALINCAMSTKLFEF